MGLSVQEALIKAAQDIMLEQGFEGATTKRIAERAGVNEVTLFRHFRNKTNLLHAALQAEVAVFERIVAHYTGDIESDLLHLATEYLALSRQQGPLMAIAFFEVARQPELAALLDGQTKAFQQVAALFVRYQSAGLLRPMPPEIALIRFIGPIVFSTLIQHNMPGLFTFSDELYVQDLVRGFLDGHRLAHDSASTSGTPAAPGD
jgi:AcrR family transcriptional regulator